MSRYTSPLELVQYSAMRPDRFDRDDAQYVAPGEGVDRDVDQAPTKLEGGPPVYANRGFAHLKGGR